MNFIRAILFLVLCSCSVSKIERSLIAMEDEFHDHTGFLIVDPSSNKTLLDYKSDKYFTPASNTKILTFYASLKLLGDSIPALYYKEIGDSLIFWGTGDPSLLYKEAPSTKAYDFLKESDKHLYFSAANFMDSKYAPGWAWDDLEYNWSAEKSSMPVYGNTFQLSNEIGFKVYPQFFEGFIITADSLNETKCVRLLGTNNFVYNPGPTLYSEDFAFGTSGQLTADILYDTLKRKVSYIDNSLSKDHKVLYSKNGTELLKVMMQDSDNMIAEQLLLVISGLQTDTLNTVLAIKNIKSTFFKGMHDEPKWVDGSGLSRYNALTPRSLVWILTKLYDEYGESILEYFPAGGESGTLKNYYKADIPYVFAKTGTMTKHHNLSGYLKTKKGKIFIFSFMNNNYTTSSLPVKRKMEELLYDIYFNN
ncbi:D-alanyl-D-alanine carboxypeptidase/D-alanyl-D-alanine-endopeptidase [Fulvivirga lutea]|uniref:D-alanyl-D-alanine carboxypeptidase n=1 Tax=Fulvivirga lutea TaxID=2810512 RepID=A0A974WIU8_9BACT|nr:D-alanyl-D-alanine carboxypeptidase [Fulvivirga lutea]QSE98002.1 D-alanyl-D-alanine carboxypeptidase [Fulvivirga lutea]